MIKFITNLIKIIIIFFIFFLFLIKMYFFINEKVQENYYPFIFDYSYIKSEIDNKNLNINQNEYLITKNIDTVNKGDIIVYLKNNIVNYAKVKEVTEEYYICSDGYNNENINVLKEEYKAKVVYQNKTLSKVFNILINPIVIILLIIYCVFIDQITYKRFK